MKKVKLLAVFFFVQAFTCIFCQITPSKNSISIAVNQPQNPAFTYDSAFRLCQSAGMGETGLFLLWDSLEKAPGVYDLSYLSIANWYYPAYKTPIDLTIATINTNRLAIPADLASMALDSSVVIARFKLLLDTVFKTIPSLTLSSLIIGSEVDVYLSGNALLWNQYTNFYSSVAAYARYLRPSLKVTCEATMNGITGADSSFLKTLHHASDCIAISYYPLNPDYTVKPVTVIQTDFAKVISIYPDISISFSQYGYPSSASCLSSDEQQAQFITQTFTSWDAYANHIRSIEFTWLHDISASAVNYYESYYGVSDSGFLDYLGSLGLRTYAISGANKPAFNELICQAGKRGYNTLNCLTGISANEKAPGILIYPNPAINKIYFSNDTPGNEFFIEIYNTKGIMLTSGRIDCNLNNSFDISGLASGIYTVRVKENNIIKSEKLVKY